MATPPSSSRGVSNSDAWPYVTHVINCYGCVRCVVRCCCGTFGRRSYVSNMLLRGIHEYARQPRRFICAPTRCIHYARPLAIPRASFKSALSVQTAPGWGVLGYRNSTTAEFYIPEAYIAEGSLLGSCTNWSRMGSSGIWKFHRNMNSIFQKLIFQNAPYLGPVQIVPKWNALGYGNSSTAEFDIPEAYIPNGSFLGSCTNGFSMGSSGM